MSLTEIYDLSQVTSRTLLSIKEGYEALTQPQMEFLTGTRLHAALRYFFDEIRVRTREEYDQKIGDFLRGNGQFAESRETRSQVSFDEKTGADILIRLVQLSRRAK